MEIERTALAGVVVITPHRHGDARGFFAETFNSAAWAAAGITPGPFREEVEWPLEPGKPLLTLPYQSPPRARGLLLRCALAAARVVVVEARTAAPDYGRRVEFTLSAEAGAMLWVPPGRLTGWTAPREAAVLVSNATDYLIPELAGEAPADLAGWVSPFAYDGDAA